VQRFLTVRFQVFLIVDVRDKLGVKCGASSGPESASMKITYACDVGVGDGDAGHDLPFLLESNDPFILFPRHLIILCAPLPVKNLINLSPATDKFPFHAFMVV